MDRGRQLLGKPAALAVLCGVLASCAVDRPRSLALVDRLAPNVGSLDRTRPDGPLIPADRPLTPAELGLLAVQNSPDLRAARAQRGVAQAQVIEAGLLPDPVLSGSYGVLLGGPAFANAIGATLSQDITALVTLSARRRAAREKALQVDADLVWQEWQAISRAQTLAIDLVEQARLLASLERTLDALKQRASITAAGVRQGNATLQSLAPDVAALTSLQTQYQAAILAQEQRWQSLDALLGLLPDVRPMLAKALDIPPITAAEADRLLASLPERRPDLVALQLGYSAQQATLRAAVLGQFPALTLGPNYGNDTSRVQTLGPSASLSLPLFNRNRGQIAIQQATREQLRAEYLARLDSAMGGTRSLKADLALVERQLVDARAGVSQTRALAAGASNALGSGLLDELTYVELLSTQLEKERQVIGLEQQVFDDRTALATLLGIGLPPVKLVLPKEPSLF
jgi:outer membrane protein TolC